MTRLTNLRDVMFPVELRPVHVSIPDQNGERLVSIPDKRAVVNLATGHVFGVVSRNYRLVTNSQALEMAYECCCAVFPETTSIEWQVTALDAPGTGGHCYIDLTHNSTMLDFNAVPPTERPDIYGPFIRVTNSYNGLRALTFDIGFFRKVCNNGLILPGWIIQFSFCHSRRELPDRITFEVARDRLQALKITFGDYLGALRHCVVQRDQFVDLVLIALNIHEPPSELAAVEQCAERDALVEHLSTMSDKYASSLGETAYTVFNVITEFSSNPPANRCIHRERNSLQRLAGSWVSSFAQECRRSDFKTGEYITRMRNGVRKLSDATVRPSMPARTR